MSITAEYLRAIYQYDPITGVFTRRTNRRRWKAGSIAGSKDKAGYIRIVIDGEQYYAHCLAWLYMTGVWPERKIDHKDLNKARNVWDNLRLATNVQNSVNKGLNRNNSTGAKGVVAYGKLYRAYIKHEGRQIHLGYYDKIEDASKAYESAAKKLWGEFARTT